MKTIYQIDQKKFKGIYVAIHYTMPIKGKEQLSKSAVLASVLGKSSEKFPDQSEIETYLFGLYNTQFDVNVQKIGDLYSMEFRLELVSKTFLPNQEDIMPKCLQFLEEIIYHPRMIKGAFDPALVEREKEAILQRIRQRKDDKMVYAVSKMEELLFDNQIAGAYLFGEESVVEKLEANDIYEQYKYMLKHSCITTILSGNLEGYKEIENTITDIFKDKLESNVNYQDILADTSSHSQVIDHIKETIENQMTNQSVITYGLDVMQPSVKDYYTLSVYNAILGATPSSKLFQNFREKESLAYTVYSRYYRFKNSIIIYAGIEKKNYERAKIVIEEQLRQIQAGEITTVEFEAAKNNIISNLQEWKDSRVAIAKMFLSNLVAYKADTITIEEMCEKFKLVTIEDVISISKRVKIKEIFLLGGEADV